VGCGVYFIGVKTALGVCSLSSSVLQEFSILSAPELGAKYLLVSLSQCKCFEGGQIPQHLLVLLKQLLVTLDRLLVLLEHL
jgi:hypothetical protein